MFFFVRPTVRTRTCLFYNSMKQRKATYLFIKESWTSKCLVFISDSGVKIVFDKISAKLQISLSVNHFSTALNLLWGSVNTLFLSFSPLSFPFLFGLCVLLSACLPSNFFFMLCYKVIRECQASLIILGSEASFSTEWMHTALSSLRQSEEALSLLLFKPFGFTDWRMLLHRCVCLH